MLLVTSLIQYSPQDLTNVTNYHCFHCSNTLSGTCPIENKLKPSIWFLILRSAYILCMRYKIFFLEGYFQAPHITLKKVPTEVWTSHKAQNHMERINSRKSTKGDSKMHDFFFFPKEIIHFKKRYLF